MSKNANSAEILRSLFYQKENKQIRKLFIDNWLRKILLFIFSIILIIADAILHFYTFWGMYFFNDYNDMPDWCFIICSIIHVSVFIPLCFMMYDKSILDKLNKNEKDCEIINENDFDFNKFSISLLQKIFPNWANIIFDIILLLFVCMIIHYCSSIMIFFKGFPETRNEKYVLTDHGEITDYITKEQYVKAKYVQTHIWSGFLTFFLLLPVLFYYKRLLSKDNQTIFNQ